MPSSGAGNFAKKEPTSNLDLIAGNVAEAGRLICEAIDAFEEVEGAPEYVEALLTAVRRLSAACSRIKDELTTLGQRIAALEEFER